MSDFDAVKRKEEGLLRPGCEQRGIFLLLTDHDVAARRLLAGIYMAQDTLHEYRRWSQLGGTLECLDRHFWRLDGALPLLHRPLSLKKLSFQYENSGLHLLCRLE